VPWKPPPKKTCMEFLGSSEVDWPKTLPKSNSDRNIDETALFINYGEY